MQELTWVEISKSALKNNIQQFRKLVGPDCILCPPVKANAYGHGLVGCGQAFVDAGADWLAINSIEEAIALREVGIKNPLYLLGYVALSNLEKAVDLECRLVVYNKETIDALGSIGKPVKVHVKLETGTNRQGVLLSELVDFAKYIGRFSNIELEGLSSHFANIEDTTDHSYAEKQLVDFNEGFKRLEQEGFKIKLRHCSNSAATILFSKIHYEMVRPGIACYGMWPSNETYVSYLKDHGEDFKLEPAFSWKTTIVQIKTIPAGEYIGYGCTYKTTHVTKLAILPVGYYDGYDRCVSGAYVLIRGKRAPVRGRISMNVVVVDVTDIEDAALEDEVVLIGRSGDEVIRAEDFAKFAGTINYEVVTRVNERITRRFL